MMPLCELLGITLNELLSGKRLSTSEYQQNAEENIMKLIKEKSEAKFRLILEVVVIFLTLLASVSLIMVAGLSELKNLYRVVLTVIAIVILVGGIGVAAALEMRQAVFKCRKCDKRFIPTKAAYFMGLHTITRRYLRCPHCNQKSWAKRCLTLETDEE